MAAKKWDGFPAKAAGTSDAAKEAAKLMRQKEINKVNDFVAALWNTR